MTCRWLKSRANDVVLGIGCLDAYALNPDRQSSRRGELVYLGEGQVVCFQTVYDPSGKRSGHASDFSCGQFFCTQFE